jgi:hypothetical protein
MGPVFSLGLPDLVQDRKGAGATGGQLQHIERQTFGFLGSAAALRLHGAILERRQVTARLACAEACEVQLAAARAGKAAAAGTQLILARLAHWMAHGGLGLDGTLNAVADPEPYTPLQTLAILSCFRRQHLDSTKSRRAHNDAKHSCNRQRSHDLERR